MEISNTVKIDETIYLNENRYDNPKESFKQVADLLKLRDCIFTESLIDLGCATGEFLYFVRQINPSIKLDGREFSINMVNSSKEFLLKHKVNIDFGDVRSLAEVKDSSFDFVTMFGLFGVTSVFEDFRPIFDEMIRIAKNGGTCLNHMLVNELDIDVVFKYMKPGTKIEGTGNKFSLRSIQDFLEHHPLVKNFKFVKHEMPFDIKKTEDLMRTWTEKINGKRTLWNGLNMEVSLYNVIFEIKK